MDHYSSLKRLMGNDLECHYFDSLESTSSFLSSLPSSNITQLCVTREQTHGKGQHGREWLSQKDGSILFSIRQTFGIDINLSGFSLVVGLAIIKALEKECRIDGFKIKWPNDIYFRGAKLAGILLENRIQEGSQSITIGVGLNYHLEQEMFCDIPWIDLSKIAKKLPDIHELTASIINNILSMATYFKLNGLSSLISQWDQYDMLKGVKLKSIEFGRSFEGEVLGISDQGALKVLTKNGTKELYSSKNIDYI
ncbi:biotin--[acetyl-CoA-carboxylase] ligase [Candidatus Thioglobus sp.]|nr:biotin--[acetyl-CoA-carboxylase] ligase [Candidatus Thioglobus sp.]